MADEISDESRALASTRQSLQASIAVRSATPHPSADFAAVTNRERAGLAEVEDRLKQIAPEFLASLQKEESAHS